MKKRAKKTEAAIKQPQEQLQAPSALWMPVEGFLNRHARSIVPLLVLVATLRIAATYPVLSHTYDEPAHLASGMEWIEKGTYTLEPQHPPLTRVLIALLPWLNGARGGHSKLLWDEGLGILYAAKSFDTTLTLARAGVLPLFWLGCWALFLCTRWIAGTPAAVIAVFLFTMTPTALAHAGLATTDMGHFATFLLATYTAWRFAAQPTWRRAIYFGLATGAAVLAKFSALAFLPMASAVGLAAWWLLERPAASELVSLLRGRLPGLAAAVVGARLREVGAKEVFFNQYVPAQLEMHHGFPPLRPLDVQGPGQGWNAVRLTPLKYGLFGDTRYAYEPGFRFWVDDAAGAERIGGGILLIRNPPK